MQDIRLFVFKARFSDGRGNFLDVRAGLSEREVELAATNMVKNIDQAGFGCDEFAEVDMLGEIATDADTVIEDINQYKDWLS